MSSDDRLVQMDEALQSLAADRQTITNLRNEVSTLQSKISDIYSSINKSYDLVVRTSEDFAKIIDIYKNGSDNLKAGHWYNSDGYIVKSVLFAEDITCSEYFVIPSEITKISAINGAIIYITASSTGRIAYDTDTGIAPEDSCVQDLIISITRTDYTENSDIIGFYGFNNMQGCRIQFDFSDESNTGKVTATGFHSCKNLVNCSANLQIYEGSSVGYNSCTNLLSCIADTNCQNGTAVGYKSCYNGSCLLGDFNLVGNSYFMYRNQYLVFKDKKLTWSVTQTDSTDNASGSTSLLRRGGNSAIDPLSCEGANTNVCYIQNNYEYELAESMSFYGADELCFIGYKDFTFTNPLILPSNIKKISGIGQPRLIFTLGTKVSAIIQQSSEALIIENLHIICTTTLDAPENMYILKSLTGMYNCKFESTLILNNTSGDIEHIGLLNCSNVHNCDAVLTTVCNTSTAEMNITTKAFSTCNNIYLCNSVLTTTVSGETTNASYVRNIGYSSCKNLINCIGKSTITAEGISKEEYVFQDCSKLANCSSSSNTTSFKNCSGEICVRGEDTGKSFQISGI